MIMRDACRNVNIDHSQPINGAIDLNPTQIAGAPIVDFIEGIYIAKAPNGNLLLSTIRTMQHSGEHVVVSANALAVLLRAARSGEE